MTEVVEWMKISLEVSKSGIFTSVRPEVLKCIDSNFVEKNIIDLRPSWLKMI